LTDLANNGVEKKFVRRAAQTSSELATKFARTGKVRYLWAAARGAGVLTLALAGGIGEAATTQLWPFEQVEESLDEPSTSPESLAAIAAACYALERSVKEHPDYPLLDASPTTSEDADEED